MLTQAYEPNPILDKILSCLKQNRIDILYEQIKHII